MRVASRAISIPTRVVGITEKSRVGTCLTAQRCAVMYHCRSVSLNPWKWKNDPKATPKQQELYGHFITILI